MIRTEKLDNVMDALLEEGDVELTPELQSEIENSTALGILDRYLTWNGIVGYTEQIVDAMETISKADTTWMGFDVNRIVEYMWKDEELSYRETYDLPEEEDAVIHALRNEDKTHIFCSLANLHVTLEVD